MISILNIFVILQLILYKTISPDFIDICFKSVFHPNININFKVNVDLPFIPDLIQVDVHTKKDTSQKEILEFEHLLMKKAGFQCFDALKYKVSMKDHKIIAINVTVSWGDERFIIEKFQMAVRSGFIASSYLLQGHLENMILVVRLDHDFSIPRISVSLNFFIPNIHWSTEIRPLFQNERYCAAFLTHEFSKILVFKEDSFGHLPPLEYYVFTVKTDHYMSSNLRVEKSYLVKIYPCQTPVHSETIVKIYVLKYNKKIEFELSEQAHRIVHRLTYKKHESKFERETNDPTFDFQSLQIQVILSIENAVEERGGILLLENCENWFDCKVELIDKPGIFKEVIMKQIFYPPAMVLRRIHYFDTSTDEYGVFPMRFETQSKTKPYKLK